MTKIDWDQVLQRIIEETGAKNARDLDDIVDVPKNYSYSIPKRGMSRGYLEQLIKKAGHVDLNYIIKGERGSARDEVKAMREILNRLTSNPELVDRLSVQYESASDKAREELSEGEYYEEILRFLLRLIAIALENKGDS